MLTGKCKTDCTVPKVGRCYAGEVYTNLPADRWHRTHYKWLKYFERIDKVEDDGNETPDS